VVTQRDEKALLPAGLRADNPWRLCYTPSVESNNAPQPELTGRDARGEYRLLRAVLHLM
jgi:hypothetical protein